MEARLIEEVSRFPVLYDTSLEEYKHIDLKNNVWKDITQALFHTDNPFIIEKVKNKWKNLRDTFVKSQRKKDRPNVKPWKLESEMKFLIPHINQKVSSMTNFDSVNTPYQNVSYERLMTPSPDQSSKDKALDMVIKKEEDLDSCGQSNEDNIVMQHVETVMEEPRRQPQKRRKRESFPTDGRHFLDISEQADRYEQCIPQYDAIDSYFLGIAQTVKRLKPINQVLLKKSISNLVFDAELKETEAMDLEGSSYN